MQTHMHFRSTCTERNRVCGRSDGHSRGADNNQECVLGWWEGWRMVQTLTSPPKPNITLSKFQMQRSRLVLNHSRPSNRDLQLTHKT